MDIRRAFFASVIGFSLIAFGCNSSDQEDSGPKTIVDDDAGDGFVGDGESGDVEEGLGDTAGGDGETADTTPGGETGIGDAGDVEADTDAGIDCSVDSDSDGLNDCEEAELCTDPNDGDTDGDNLGDFEELQEQTDPCSADSDGGGADDGEELEFGLDPNDPSDDDKWVLTACDDPQSEPVDFYTSQSGNWKVALPPAFNNYAALTITNPGALDAGAVYDDPSNEIAGALISKKADSTQSSPNGPITGRVPNKVLNVAGIEDKLLTGEFDTHDFAKAASVEYELSTSTKKSARRLRDEILFELAPYDRSDVSGLPSSAGSTYSNFQAEISVIQRDTPSGEVRNLISVAVAPLEKYKNVGKVEFRMDDLTNTTNVARSSDEPRTRCTWDKPDEDDPKLEFYWVLDQSGSMSGDNSTVESFASNFVSEVGNTSLDFRLGVTNMDPRNEGHLHVPPAWHTDPQTFASEVQDRATDCVESPQWQCSGGYNPDEMGIQAAMDGLRYMLGNTPQSPTSAEKIRTDAEIVTIWMSDEPAQGDNSGAKQFFRDRSTAFAITAQGSCGSSDGRFQEVALASGGGSADLCKGDLTDTLQEIIIEASGLASQFALGQTPISSSLRVYLNGKWVPRNTQNGFDYFPQQNAIAFYGDFRPEGKDEGVQGETDYISVTFERYRQKCKYIDGETCEPGGGSEN